MQDAKIGKGNQGKMNPYSTGLINKRSRILLFSSDSGKKYYYICHIVPLISQRYKWKNLTVSNPSKILHLI